jgi:hypothetical protein
MDSGCGYHSCPCRGVNFIVGGLGSWEYCVDGKRVRVSDDSRVETVSATEAQIVKLELYLLDNYAEYLRWRYDPARGWRREVPISPFGWVYPLLRRKAVQSC